MFSNFSNLKGRLNNNLKNDATGENSKTSVGGSSYFSSVNRSFSKTSRAVALQFEDRIDEASEIVEDEKEIEEEGR